MAVLMSDTSRINPYVGPRSFKPTEASQFFGRDRDARQLFDTLLAERIVLLHSPSGAGKTSLLHAKLIPMMRSEGFHVFPPIRVNAAAHSGWSFKSHNRYVRSAITCLEGDRQRITRKGVSLGMRTVAAPTLAEYLAERKAALLPDSQSADADQRSFVPELLIFDQFEEILTVDAVDHNAKLEFFQQLGAALIPRYRWALFAMREEYVAALESYLSVLPSALGTRQRLDLLTEKAATDAIVKPASLEAAKGKYTEAALNRLLTNLRTIAGTGAEAPRLDRLIEPVHLQVACSTVWEGAMKAADARDGLLTIEESHVAKVGDVDGALQTYYAESVAAAAEAGDISEAKIRRWLGVELITRGIRTQVLKGTEGARGITNAAAKILEDRYIIRVESRRSAVWYELAHDRLIDPVKKSNRDWFFSKGQGDLHSQAEIWNRDGRPRGALLQGEALVRAKAILAQYPDSETPELADFLADSEAFVARTRTAMGVVAVFLIALLGYGLWHQINDKKEQAEELITAHSLSVWRDSALKATGAAREAAWQLPIGAQRGPLLVQSIRADSAIRTLTDRSATAPAADTVHYFVKPSDPKGAQPALVALGFPVTIRVARAEEVETNAIAFGSATDPANRRLLALALVRAGIALKRICPPFRGTGGPHSLQVFGATQARELPAITLSQIAQLSAEAPGINCTPPQ